MGMHDAFVALIVIQNKINERNAVVIYNYILQGGDLMWAAI